ncbi:MAG: hypothetical protein K0U98_12680 [Deltaproteobacteria bacterium]|nr:hypothetical protein [Deltaproteobacteria bacterium]
MKPSYFSFFGGLLIALMSLMPTATLASGLKADAALERIRNSQLELGKAVSVTNLKLNTGMAILEIQDGTVIPTEAPGAHAMELVFLGNGSLTLEAPNAIEASQLDLFTGSETLHEDIESGVFVVALDAAANALLDRQTLPELDREVAQRATELLHRWRSSPERRLLDIEGALLGDALDDPFYEGYFAGWLQGAELGSFLYVAEPSAPEQVTLGQFVVLEASEKEKRKIRRELHRQQRQGRFIGLDVADLGTWDTWLSSSRYNDRGEPRPGKPAFAAKHYELDIRLAQKDLHLSGHARIHLEAASSLGRVAHLRGHSDLEVSKVTLDGGEELFFHHSGEDLLVILPNPPEEGSLTVVDVHYSGRMVEKLEGKTYFLRDTVNWYPHAGEFEMATYDVTFHWPQRLELLASGRQLESGVAPGGMKWQRRKLDIPSFAFSFEIGRYRTLTQQAGHVEISLSLDVESKSLLKGDHERLLQTLADSLTFYEENFGPYPLDHLAAVTSPRRFSQSLLGFITLSTLMMLDEGGIMSLFFGFEDPRTVIAHEVAHQWWGHIVGMSSYHEQWISESMANYSAILFARKKLWTETRSLVGPTTGWQTELTRQTSEGRTIESLGPLTLGQRLVSSHSSSAYSSIVYKKGAVVVDMLSRFFGEEAFLRVLKAATEHIALRPVTTESFLEILSRISGFDLAPFADQFIYGTGLPEIYYDYRFEPDGEGWKIFLSAQQQSPVRYTYRIIERGEDRLDVARRAEAQVDTSKSAIAVPIRIVGFDPKRVEENKSPRRGKSHGSGRTGNVNFLTHRMLSGESTLLELPLQIEPRSIILDPDREVFGQFFSETRNPKRVLLRKAWDLAATQQTAKAEELFEKALTAEVLLLDSEPGKARRDTLEEEGKRLDSIIFLGLARLNLDTDRLQAAARYLASADALIRRDSPLSLKNRLRGLQGRAALLGGDADEAFRILQKAFLKKGRLSGSTEIAILVGITAQQLGRTEVLELAIQRAAESATDISALLTR